MKTDPRAACANTEERKAWAIVHDLIAHPLMALTLWSTWALRFHDWTSAHAWPRKPLVQARERRMLHVRHGLLGIKDHGDGRFSVRHIGWNHTITHLADDEAEAIEMAAEWFDGVARDTSIKRMPPMRYVSWREEP